MLTHPLLPKLRQLKLSAMALTLEVRAAPGVNRTLLQELASCQFIVPHENVLICGPSGVGKSHLANGLAYEALKRDCRVLVRPTHRLLQELQVARANGSYTRHLARILNVDLLVLDDYGLQPVTAQGRRTCTRSSASATSTARSSSPATAASRSGGRCSATSCWPARGWTG